MKKLYLTLTVLLTFLLSGFAQTECNSMRYQDSIFHDVTVTSGIYFATATPYGALAQPQNLYLDFYQPTGDTLKKRPLIIFQFGGAFLIGTRNQPVIPGYSTYFAKCGYVVASIDYRIGFDVLSTGSTERAVYRAVQDLRASIRYLCQNADQFGIDTNSIFLTGTSAGCISALCSSFMTEAQLPSAIHGILTEPSDLGGIDSSGNNDYGNRYVAPRGIISHWGAILDTTFITTNNPIPVLGIHGTADVIVPYDTGSPFGYPVFPVVYGDHPVTTRMTNLGIKNTLVPLVGYSHEPELLSPQICDTMDNEGRIFLWSILKPTAPPITGPAVICREHSATYSVTPSAGSKYCWQLTGNGTITHNTGNTITVLWADTGMVTVTMTELNYMVAQADPVSFETEVIPAARASFVPAASQLQVNCLNTSSNTSSFFWTFGNGDTSTVNSPVETYTSGGTYTITLVAGNGVCADTIAKSVTIDSCPVAGFTYHLSNMNGFFYGDTTNTTAYFWSFGDGDSITANAADVLHQYAHSGTYTVIMGVENHLGCRSRDTVVIEVVNAGINNTDGAGAAVICDLTNGCDIKLNNQGEWTLEVYDMLGRRLSVQTISTGFMLHTSGFEQGVYLLKLYSGNQTIVKKFIKQ